MTTRPTPWMPLALVLGCVSIGCADRASDLTLDGTETSSPYAPGDPLGACVDVGDCFDEWCVHPAGENGFCTYACGGPDGCPEPVGGTATKTCLLVEGVDVCALDCSGGHSCPAGMRCEQIQASDGAARSICF
jgi:hypothetical protein